MADISVGAAVGEGFALIGRQPLVVLLWGFARTILIVAVFALLAPMYLAMVGVVLQSAQPGAGPPNFAAMPGYWQLQGVAQLLNLGQAFVGVILYCAVFRAVLHPEQSSFGYMRVGAAELYLFVLLIALVFAVFIGVLVLIIPIAIIAGVLAVANAGVVAAILIPLMALAAVVVMIYVALRFSMVGPMIVDDGQFHLMESWNLTRGRVGSLFLIGLSLFGILLVAEIVIGGVILAIGAGTLSSAAGGFDHLKEFFQQPPAVIVSKFIPLLIVLGLLAIPLTGCSLAIISAPWARAYRDLAPGHRDAAATFA